MRAMSSLNEQTANFIVAKVIEHIFMLYSFLEYSISEYSINLTTPYKYNDFPNMHRIEASEILRLTDVAISSCKLRNAKYSTPRQYDRAENVT